MADMTYAEALTLAANDPIKLQAMGLSGRRPDGTVIESGGVTAFAGESITVSTSVVPATDSTYAPDGQTPASSCLATVDGAAIRLRTTGDAPTGAAGHLIGDGGSFEIIGAANIVNLRMIRDGAASADAAVEITYYR